MLTSRCVYCGALAEYPAQLAWIITDDTDDHSLEGSLPLCVRCSQSWCVQTPPRVPACNVEKMA
jgi:hypothetical protein